MGDEGTARSGEPLLFSARMSQSIQPIHLLVCVGPRCDAEGRGRALLAEIESALRTVLPRELADGRLKLSTRECLRLCTSDPVVRLEPSGDAFSGPDLDQLMRDIAAAVKGEN